MGKIPRVSVERTVEDPPRPSTASLLTTAARTLPAASLLGLRDQSGGVGAGTITRFKVTAGGRTRAYRMLVDEPVPGRVLTKDTESAL